MNLKMKKGLILICSSLILFASVFYVTRSLNTLMSEKNEKNNIASSKKVAKSKDINKNMVENKTNYYSDESIGNMRGISDDLKSKHEENNNITNCNKNYINYIVQEGDTLFSIAKKNMPCETREIALKSLEKINNLKNREVIPVGTHLIIPANTSNNCTNYIVKKGEDLYSIAKNQFPNTDTNHAVNIIMKKNNIQDPSKIKAGIKLYIPNEK